MNTKYVFSAALAVFLRLAVARMQRGVGAVLMLEGPPGGGKTSFARALAQELGAELEYYSGSPDKERDLLYEIDVQGVLKRENAWVPGAAWKAFEASSQGRFAVLLIDEVDKTHPGFDAFLLRLLEEWTFRSPDGTEVKADPSKIAVVMTSNGRRELRPEVLRRSQRIHLPLPTGDRLKTIVRQLAEPAQVRDGLLDLVIRIGNIVRGADGEQAPSPKELANACVDFAILAHDQVLDEQVWREVAVSWLVKSGGAALIDKATNFKWLRAIMSEARKGRTIGDSANQSISDFLLSS